MAAKFSPSFSPEAIRRLCEPDEWLLDVDNGCIRVQPARPSILRIDSSNSRLGNIDQLPPELQLLVIEQLDFRSLARLMRTSRKGKALVEGLAEFIDMIEHAPEVLTALGKTNIISHHSAASLRQVLWSQKCASCFGFGQLLFLPTCERICPSCVLYNDAFWMTTPSLAKECFCLSDDQLNTIPIMRVIPGAYGFWEHYGNSGPARGLVSVKQVKQLGLQLHGSEEALAVLKPAPPPPPSVEVSQIIAGDSPWTDEATSYLSRRGRHDFIQRIHSLELEPPGRHLHSAPVHGSGDHFVGTAICKFPSLSKTGPDNGYICTSCWTFSQEFRDLPNWRQFVPDHCRGLSANEVGCYYQRITTIVHSEAEFAEHLEHCPGVPLLLAGLEEADKNLGSENTANDDYRDSEDENSEDGGDEDGDDGNANDGKRETSDDESSTGGGSEYQEGSTNEEDSEDDE